MPRLGIQPRRRPIRNSRIREVHGIAVVVRRGKLLVRREFFFWNLAIVMIVVMVGMTVLMLVVVTMRGQSAKVNMRTLGMLDWFSYASPRVRMRDRRALGNEGKHQEYAHGSPDHLTPLFGYCLQFTLASAAERTIASS